MCFSQFLPQHLPVSDKSNEASRPSHLLRRRKGSQWKALTVSLGPTLSETAPQSSTRRGARARAAVHGAWPGAWTDTVENSEGRGQTRRTEGQIQSRGSRTAMLQKNSINRTTMESYMDDMKKERTSYLFAQDDVCQFHLPFPWA